MKFIERRYRTYNNKNSETIMSEHREVLQLCKARKPDIVRYGPVSKSTEVVEITISYHMYFEQALNGKHEKYLHLLNVLENLGFKAKMNVYFGLFGNVPKNCIKMVRKLYKNRDLNGALHPLLLEQIISGEIGLRSYWCDVATVNL